MSTQLRRFAQAPAHSPARAKFFLALADISAVDVPVPDAGEYLVSLSPGFDFQSAMSETDFTAAFASGAGGFAVPANGILKDLGREVVVYANGVPSNHLYKYRQVQLVNGAGSEGVFDSAATTAPNPWQSNMFILIWAASGSAAPVVRTG
jgi:hypothetical protein